MRKSKKEFNTDIMLHDYNFSKDVRDWVKKNGNKPHTLTKKQMQEYIPGWYKRG